MTEEAKAEVVKEDGALALAVRDLEPSSAAMVRAAFETMFAGIEGLEAMARTVRVADEHDARGIKLARECRLAFKDVRVKAEHARKLLKERSLREGRAVDGVAGGSMRTTGRGHEASSGIT